MNASQLGNDQRTRSRNVVISGSDFLHPGSAGVREPRNPSPQNSSDSIAIPEPPAPDVGPDAPPLRDPSGGQKRGGRSR